MNNNQGGAPAAAAAAAYDNVGFQADERRPPPYSPQHVYPVLPQEIPSYVVQTPRPSIISTQQTSAPVVPPASPPRRKGRKKCQWKLVLCGCLCAALVLAVLAILLWYFLYYQCLLGKSCRAGGRCLSTSQWCDGVSDCERGEDEAQCFRLHGTNFLLQSYSPSSEAWMPVCAEQWNNNYGQTVCEQMGYTRQDYISYNQINAGSLASKGYMMLKPGSSHSANIQSQLTHSQSCPRAVQLHCIECGQSSAGPSSRVVGGTDAANGAWPWQVSLQINGEHVCGGSIIGASWILSAAHCFQRYSSPRIWRVYSGDVSKHRLSFTSGNAVDRIINHEGYDPETNNNDIALLRLTTPLTFSRTVKPVCLPNAGVNPGAGTTAWVTGWGALHSNGPSPDRLNQAQVTIYSRETCNQPSVLDGQVTQTMICAGKLSGGVDTCQGDSGGPMVVKEGNVWWLAGDTSWGIGCALRNKPGVYGNVSYFSDWVYRQLQKY